MEKGKDVVLAEPRAQRMTSVTGEDEQAAFLRCACFIYDMLTKLGTVRE